VKLSPQQIEANVGKLAKRLEENPNDPQGWVMLGRSYTMMSATRTRRLHTAARRR